MNTDSKIKENNFRMYQRKNKIIYNKYFAKEKKEGELIINYL